MNFKPTDVTLFYVKDLLVFRIYNVTRLIKRREGKDRGMTILIILLSVYVLMTLSGVWVGMNSTVTKIYAIIFLAAPVTATIVYGWWAFGLFTIGLSLFPLLLGLRMRGDEVLRKVDADKYDAILKEQDAILLKEQKDWLEMIDRDDH